MWYWFWIYRNPSQDSNWDRMAHHLVIWGIILKNSVMWHLNSLILDITSKSILKRVQIEQWQIPSTKGTQIVKWEDHTEEWTLIYIIRVIQKIIPHFPMNSCRDLDPILKGRSMVWQELPPRESWSTSHWRGLIYRNKLLILNHKVSTHIWFGWWG